MIIITNNNDNNSNITTIIIIYKAGLNGIKSNPHSFIHHHHLLDGEGDSLKGSCGGGRARFMLREGDCDLGCCVLEEEDDCHSEVSAHPVHFLFLDFVELTTASSA